MVMQMPVMIADVITPKILSPKASPQMNESGFSLLTSFWATLAVVEVKLLCPVSIILRS